MVPDPGHGGVDPIPQSKIPSLRTVTTALPPMPKAWSAVALLHPFSPPLSSDPHPDCPFFQLCLANVAFVEGEFFSAQISGCDYGTWWYVTSGQGTRLSVDEGKTWNAIDVGWKMPANWFGADSSSAECAGSSPLNWLDLRPVDWWKGRMGTTAPFTAIWMWLDAKTHAPNRMMFGQGPPSPRRGDPDQLALFQMYSFTYLPEFQVLAGAPKLADIKWTPPSIAGFAPGNPKTYKNFVWDGNFGMTVFMTPVNQAFNPLPTRVLYVWKRDQDYAHYTDRAQHTLMQHEYNPGPLRSQIALLTGAVPHGTTPEPESGTGFLINHNKDGTITCIGGSQFPIPQQPPGWISVPGVDGHIRATISDNSQLCPQRDVAIYSALFPPSPPNYPEATYLWTWYAPENADGTQSRPITFMQSQSGVGVGTSLALADYFWYERLAEPIDPANFIVPSACSPQTRRLAVRHGLP